MFVEIIILLVSLAILAKSSSIVVENAVKLSKFFGISQMTIGLIFLATSTTLPELFVSIISSTMGEGAIAAGNVFGSIITNILLIFGIGGFLYGVKIEKNNIKDVMIIFALTIMMSAYIFFNNIIKQEVFGFLEGVILILLFLFYVTYALTKKTTDVNEKEHVTKKEALYAFLLFSISIILVLISASFVVETTVKISKLLGIAAGIIGATFIAGGTSLPELSICLQAIRKKYYALVLGDVMGANIINITLVLGTAAVIQPISTFSSFFIIVLLFTIIANFFIFYIASVNKELKRNGGLLFLLVYIIYILTVFYFQIGNIK